MSSLVKKEVESLDKIRNFGNLLGIARPYLSSIFKLWHYPPQAYGYAARPPKTVKIKKKILLLIASHEELDKGTIIGVYKVLEPNFKLWPLSEFRSKLSSVNSREYLCSVADSAYCKKLSTIEKHFYGNSCTYEFKLPHVLSNLERRYGVYH